MYELQFWPIKMSELRLHCAERRRFKSRQNILICISIVPILTNNCSVILCIIKVQPMLCNHFLILQHIM